MSSPNNRVAVSILNGLDVLMDRVGHRFEINQLRMLMYIYKAGSEGISLTILSEKTGLNYGSMSRAVSRLSTVPTKGVPEGYGFCERAFDPHSPKERIIKITPDGIKLIEDVAKAMTFDLD